MENDLSDFTMSTSASYQSSAEEIEKKVSKKRKSIFKRRSSLKVNTSSGDADVSTIENDCDLTPGSLDVWIDLPDEIKFDPALAPFKQLYEHHHGKLDAADANADGDKNIFAKKADLHTIGEAAANDKQAHYSPTGDRLIEEVAEDEKQQKSARLKRIYHMLRIAKLAALVAGWLFLTVSLVLNRETNDVVLHTAVMTGAVKEYHLTPMDSRTTVSIKLTGPFLQNPGRNRTLNSGLLRVWLHRSSNTENEQNSSFWTVPLQPDELMDFSQSETVSTTLILPEQIFTSFQLKEPNAEHFNITKRGDTNIAEKTKTSTTVQGINSTQDRITEDILNNTDEVNATLSDTQYNNDSKENSSELIKVRDLLEEERNKRSSANGFVDTKNAILQVIFKDGNNDSHVETADISEQNGTEVKLCMETSSNITVPVTVSYQMNPLDPEEGIIYATLLLVVLYILIVFEVVNRTVAALLCSTLSIAVLALGGCRPTLGELVSWLDVETLLLLFSMMLLVAILAETGLFDYLAVLAYEVTGGRTWPLINCLCFFTAVFSTFLDNVTTVLLMTPVTIRLCEVMHLNPVPVLISMVVFSNVGGAATPVGDPPNVIIASHPAILAEGINFTTFTLHMGVGILLVAVQTYLQLRYMYRDIKKLRHSVPHDIQELRQEMAVWRRAAASLSSYSRDEDIVRKALERKVEKLHTALMRREAGGGSKTDPKFCSTLAQMKQKYRIRDKKLLVMSAICVSFVVVVFFLHSIPELQRLSLGWTALLGALLLLLLAEREDLEPILARVEWSTLLFFAALFVLMEALSRLGLIAWIGSMTETVILSVSEEHRLAVALMFVLWVSGIASAFVDNIPLTTMMVRVIAALASPGGLALPLPPLAWALSFGACLGGNGTLIGASANVVCAGVAEQHGYRFSFLQYLKIGFPIMVGNLIIASMYLLLCHCAFTWH